MSASARSRLPLSRRRWLGQLSAAAVGAAGLMLQRGVKAAAAGDAAAVIQQPALGERVHWPTVHLLDGRRLDPPQSGQAASVVVFFSTTCPFCARHNVPVQKLLDSSRGMPLRILAVAHDEKVELVQRYLARRQLGFEVTMDQLPLHVALSRKPGIPLTCVVDRQQRLREVIRGEMFEEDVLGLTRWAQA